ncbi:helix-turn-helix domain-containing protein [Pseudoalteromonas rubra]|nr:helix-turn-helix transcriptional regulator [Pseudoalteromonas rubra]
MFIIRPRIINTIYVQGSGRKMRKSEVNRRKLTRQAHREASTGIRTLRLGMKLSQKELGKKMNPSVDQSTISNWESGKTEISFVQLVDILSICGTSFESYFGFLKKKDSED